MAQEPLKQDFTTSAWTEITLGTLADGEVLELVTDSKLLISDTEKGHRIVIELFEKNPKKIRVDKSSKLYASALSGKATLTVTPVTPE